MELITVQEYINRYKVSKQSVYARIKSGSIQSVVKDGVKMIQDVSQPLVNAESTQSQDDSQSTVNPDSIEIKYLKKEIKRLKKELKEVKKEKAKSEERIDRLFDVIVNRKELPGTTGEIVDVAMIEKKKKKKKKK